MKATDISKAKPRQRDVGSSSQVPIRKPISKKRKEKFQNIPESLVAEYMKMTSKEAYNAFFKKIPSHKVKTARERLRAWFKENKDIAPDYLKENILPQSEIWARTQALYMSIDSPKKWKEYLGDAQGKESIRKIEKARCWAKNNKDKAPQFLLDKFVPKSQHPKVQAQDMARREARKILEQVHNALPHQREGESKADQGVLLDKGLQEAVAAIGTGEQARWNMEERYQEDREGFSDMDSILSDIDSAQMAHPASEYDVKARVQKKLMEEFWSGDDSLFPEHVYFKPEAE